MIPSYVTERVRKKTRKCPQDPNRDHEPRVLQLSGSFTRRASDPGADCVSHNNRDSEADADNAQQMSFCVNGEARDIPDIAAGVGAVRATES